MTPQDLPGSWIKVRIGDIASVKGGKRLPSGATYSDLPTNHPYIRVGDFLDGTVRLDDLRYIHDGVHRAISRYVIGRDDVYISIAGTIGVAGRVPPKLHGANLTENAAKLTPCAAVDPDFLWRAFTAPEIVETVRNATIATTQPKLSLFRIEALEIPLPPLNEQRRIVAKLAVVLARSRRAKAALDAVPPLLEKLRQSILAAAFRGDLTADWRAKHPEVEPAEKLLARIRSERRRKWEEGELAKMKGKGRVPGDDRWKEKYKEPEPVDVTGLPDLPAGWCWASAEEVSHEICVGHVGPMEHRYAPTGVPFLRSQNVRANRYDPAELRYIPHDFHAELAKSRLSPGDLVVVRSGAPGTACVIPDHLTDANCADLVIARLVSLVDPYVMAFYMNCDWARAAVLDAQVGVAQQHFNVGSMRTLHMPIMPVPEQAVVRARLTAALAAVSAQSAGAAELARRLPSLERSLLAKAFRGELVPQDPNDEPAEVMLARLRQRESSVPQTTKRRAKVPT